MAEDRSNLINLSDYLPSGSATTQNDLNPPTTNKQALSQSITNILNQGIAESQVNARSNFNKAKLQTYGADMDHHQFERYYNHPKYKQLGFNPYLDNEGIYNAASSFTDDFRRTWGQWKTMVGNAFVDAAGFGPASDREAAKNMEKAMAIGTSNRGGIGGFTNNLFLNSGYTFGIMAEILAEEAVLWGATALTGGLTAEAALARTGVNAERFIKGLFKAEEWAKKGNKIVNALDNMTDVNTARQVWNAAQTGAISTGKFIGKHALGETYNFLSNFNKLENVSGAAKTAMGFGSFYRDIRNARLAFGESALEGGMVENEMIRDLYDDFVKKNGRNPNEDEASKIRTTAKTAALTTTWTNLPVIYFSNQIVLGNLTKSFSPLKRILPIEEGRFFKTILTKKGIEVVERNLTNAAKSLIKPRTYAAFGANYFAANLAEGLQESAQEVISGANKQYYTNLYNNSLRGGYYDSIADNIAKQFSPEGLEIFASGFFMGGIVSSASSVAVGAKEKALKFFDPNYAAKKEEARKETMRKATVLDEYYKDPLKWRNQHLNNLTEQEALQKQMDDAEKSGDAKKFHDSKFRSMANQFWTVFETGMEKTFLQRFDELQKLDDEELLKTVSAPDAETARKDLNMMKSKMSEFKEGYEFVQKNLANPFTPWNYKQGTPEQLEEARAYVTFNEAQKDLVFMREGFKNTLGRMNSIINESVKDTGVAGLAATDVTNLYNLPDLLSEISVLNKEITALGSEELVTDDAKLLSKQKKSKLTQLEGFRDAIIDVIKEIQPSEKEVNKEIGTGEGNIIFTKENFIKAPVYNKALKAYKSYIKSLAKGPVTDKNLENAFEKLIDYYLLDADHVNLSNSVNLLMNPKSFYEYSRRKKEVIDVEHANRKQRITEALDKYEKIRHQNDLLQELYKRNVFFDAEEWEALNKEGKMPKRLYSVTGKDQIRTTSTQYNEAVDIISQYSQNVNNIPLQYDASTDQYDTDIRSKLPGDNRTYADIAEEYGFDPKARKTTLPLRDVLQKIIDSDFATDQEQALARRLLLMAKADETVTFSKELAGPGVYTEAEQTVIDARFSSEEYAENAQSYPIETSILREEVNRRIYGLLDSDATFKQSIQDLFDSSYEYFLQERQKGIYDKPFLGLRAIDDFIKEALTNESFRDFLHEVDFADSGNTAWTDFVDSIVDTLSTTVGEFSDTALNAVINVVTTKIDSNYSKAQSQASGRPATEEEATNPRELSVEQIETLHPGLIDELIKLYQDYNALFAEIGDTAKMLDPDYASKTPEEIKNSPEFREYVRTNVSESLRAAFDRYFTKPTEVRTIERRPGIKNAITQTDQEFLLSKQIQKLRELGYEDDEIAAMDVLEGLNIIYQGETKDETAERLRQEREDLDEQRRDARQEIERLINSAENLNEWEAVDAELVARLANNPAYLSMVGISGVELDRLLENKRKELAFKTEYDDINVGDDLMIRNLDRNLQGVFTVTSKTKTKIVATNAEGITYTLKKATFKADNDKRYIFKYNNMIKPEDLEAETVSSEATDVSNDNVKGIMNFTDEDMDTAIKAGKATNEDDAFDDFFNAQDKACE